MRVKLGEPDGLVQELSQSKQALEQLRHLRDRLANTYTGTTEFFDFGLTNGGLDRAPEEQLERLVRAGLWHVIALKTEFRLKLLHTVNGYLSAVAEQNPVSCFLLARYLLEFVATINALRLQLEECDDIDIEKWRLRAFAFLGLLYRARHSTTDEGQKAIFATHGIPKSFVQPIKISKAIKWLSREPDFKWATQIYGRLSNICHQNGSAHMMLLESGRESKVIRAPDGRRFFLNEKTTVFTVNYPSTGFSSTALAMTARPAWYSATRAGEMLEELVWSTFTDEEIIQISRGKLSGVDNCIANRAVKKDAGDQSKMPSLGRNALCPCGSGKKFKRCCLTRPANA